MHFAYYDLKKQFQYRAWEAPHDTYLFSEAARLACLIEESGQYYVCNGDWLGTRNGNEFTVCYNGTVLCIDDWEERSLHGLTDKYRECWYLPSPMSMFDRFDELERQEEASDNFYDDIAF